MHTTEWTQPVNKYIKSDIINKNSNAVHLKSRQGRVITFCSVIAVYIDMQGCAMQSVTIQTGLVEGDRV